jgi:hypothetical protein
VLELEQTKYGDLVQAAFPDTPRQAVQMAAILFSCGEREMCRWPPFCFHVEKEKCADGRHLVFLWRKRNVEMHSFCFSFRIKKQD